MTQLDTLLAAFRRGESITTLEAMSQFGICRLSERCRELEARGYRIEHERVKQNGKTYTRYAMRGQLRMVA